MHPTVIAATGYPLYADAYRLYLKHFYDVTLVTPRPDGNGLSQIGKVISRTKTAAVILDLTFGVDAPALAAFVRKHDSGIPLLYVDEQPNIFRVLHYLELGVSGYLFPGDRLDGSLRSFVDRARRGERVLSPAVEGLYANYEMYRGLFNGMPESLEGILRLMAEGLGIDAICARTGLKKSIVYRRQFRLRERFGAVSNGELAEMIRAVFGETNAMGFRLEITT